MVEQQLASVQRDYDLEKLQYSDLSSKLRAAGMRRASNGTGVASSSGPVSRVVSGRPGQAGSPCA